MKTVKKIHYLITSFPILYFIGLVFLWIETDFQKEIILFSESNYIERRIFDVCDYLFGFSFISIIISFLLLFINGQNFSLRYIFSIIVISVCL